MDRELSSTSRRQSSTVSGSTAVAPNLVELLRSRAVEKGTDNVFTFLEDGETEGRRLSWVELDASARTIAAELQAAGLGGGRVLLLFPPGLEFIEAFLGCLYARVVAVPAHLPTSRRVLPRLQSIVRDATPAAVLTASSPQGWLRSAAAQVAELAELRWLASDAIEQSPAAWNPQELQGDDLAFLQYTSGSTSEPKGVMVSHRNLMHNEEMIQRAFETDEESVILGWLPLFHDMGLIGNVLQPLYVGARCVLMSPMAFLRRPRRWLEAIERYRATISGGPNFAYELCCRKVSPQQRQGLDLSSWRVAFNGAEPVRASTLETFAAAFADCGFRQEGFYPCYGLAEATLFVSGSAPARPHQFESFDARELEQHRVQVAKNPQGAHSLVSCGSSWMDLEIVIAEPESGRRSVAGEVGEIWIAGDSVAGGYWQQPEASERDFAARLVEDPAAGPYLRTGDLGFVHDGELFIAGRIKDLVIIRGRNHYPQDIELTAEGSHRSLREGGSAAFSIEVEGEERLVVVAELDRHAAGEATACGEAIREAVAESHELRVHMVVLIKTTTLPKTSSGKVQRHRVRQRYLAGELTEVHRVGSFAMPALSDDGNAAPELDGSESPELHREHLLGVDPHERVRVLVDGLCHECARALRLPDLAADDSLTSQGLDSLVAVELEQRLRFEFDLPVSVKDLLTGLSPRELADRVLLRLGEDSASLQEKVQESAAPMAWATEPLTLVDRESLSDGQKAMWFLNRLAPESGAYHIAGAARAHPAPDAEALMRALLALSERHPMLRTVFPEVGGEPKRVEMEQPTVDFAVIGLANADELQTRLADEAYRPFDLAQGPLLRLRLFEPPAGSAVLMLAVHHIIADFWSLAILLRELAALYAEAVGGERASLGPLPWSFDDAVRWRRTELDSVVGERSWRFWLETLTPLPTAPELWTDRPRPARPSGEGGLVISKLGPACLDRFRGLVRDRQTTLFAGLLSAFQVFLGRHGGQEDFLVGTPTLGRDRPELSGILGYFVEPLALRADLTGEPTFGDLIERVRDHALNAFEHHVVPLPLLVERLQPQRHSGQESLFRHMFALQQAPPGASMDLAALAVGQGGGRLRFGNVELETLPWTEPYSPFDLVLRCAEVGEELILSLQFDRELFDESTVIRWLEHYRRLLVAATKDPDRHLGELPMLDDNERLQLLGEWNDTSRQPETALLVHERIAGWARATPGALAVEDQATRLTYAELDAQAARLASLLVTRGLGPESRIGVLLGRSCTLLVAYLGIMKTGAAYVPLDPEYPRERVEFMLADAGVSVVLTSSEFSSSLPGSEADLLELDRLAGALTGESLESSALRLSPNHLAYVVYTSGSTGRPKGVAVEQRGLSNLVDWHLQTYGLSSADRATQVAGLGFDAVVWEVWPSLAAGASLHLPPAEARTSVAKLCSWLAERRITVTFLPTPLAEAILVEGDAAGRHDLALRAVLTGGDRLHLRPSADLRWQVINHYGPAENSVVATAGTIAAQGTGLPSIGSPISNVQVRLLDRRGRLVPAEAPGELCLAGASLARGYLDRPASTASRFVPDPFAEQAGQRLYRSGDLARWLRSGDIDFLGRVDHQVQLRGQRIELGEIEAMLVSHPEVEAVVASMREDRSGEAMLIAHMVLMTGAAASDETLVGYLRQRVPSAMVPSRLIRLETMPLTANGKVDRAAITQLELPQREAGSGPRNASEELLAEIFCELFDLDRVHLDDNFFALGGHSLLATRLQVRIQRVFGVDLELREIFEAPTVRLLAARLEGRRAAPSITALRPGPRQAEAPASFPQEGMWILHQLDPASPAYNIPAIVEARGHLELAVLFSSLDEIVRRHDVLRCRLERRRDTLIQRIESAPEQRQIWPRIDLSRLPAAVRQSQAVRWSNELARQPFNLATGPLVRMVLLSLGEQLHQLVLVLHHTVADGWSTGVLIRELGELYSAFASGRPSPLVEPVLQYADFARWQREHLDAAAISGDLAYWRGQLGEASSAAPPLRLPTDRPHPVVPSGSGVTRSLRLGPDIPGVLRTTGRTHDATLFMVLLAAYDLFLHRSTGMSDLVVGTPHAGRRWLESESTIGCFVDTLVIRVDLGGRPTFAELLARVRETILEAHAHRDAPFELVVEALQPVRATGQSPLFQTMFVLQNKPLETLELDGFQLKPRALDTGTAKFDLVLGLEESGAGITGYLSGRQDLFDAATLQRFVSQFETLLGAATSSPSSRLDELPVIAAAERHQLLVEWGQSSQEAKRSLIVERFAAQADLHPSRVAVRFLNETLTYADLDAQSNQLAHELRRRGAGADVRVALMLERSIELVVAVMAVLKTGGAYVPLDPGDPPQRIALIVEDSAPRFVLTHSQWVARLAEVRWAGDGPEDSILELDREAAALALCPVTRLAPNVHPGNLAYVIYTSGSTGRPKGVMVSRDSLASYLSWVEHELFADRLQSLPLVTRITFDASLKQLLAPLLHGAAVRAVPEAAVASAVDLLAQLDGEAGLNCVPSLWEALVAVMESDSKAVPTSLRYLMVGGEELTPALIERTRAVLPELVLINLYGPTEATSNASWAIVDRESSSSLGRPLSGLEIRVCDPSQRPVPTQTVGEICISGAGLARGYLGQAATTALAFVPKTGSEKAGERLYRTGDRGRWRSDGDLEFLGRLDRQVKVRGFRIELDEIEATLSSHTQVREAAVVLSEAATGEPSLVAHVMTRGEAALETELGAFLRQRLPSYMLPRQIIVHLELPRTSTGKLDRAALAATVEEEELLLFEDLAPEVGASTPVEEVLAGMMAEVLGLEEVGVRDNFFELGGHSMYATELNAMVQDAFEIEVPLFQVLFDSPTVETMATFLLEDPERRRKLEAMAPILLELADEPEADDDGDSSLGDELVAVGSRSRESSGSEA